MPVWDCSLIKEQNTTPAVTQGIRITVYPRSSIFSACILLIHRSMHPFRNPCSEIAGCGSPPVDLLDAVFNNKRLPMRFFLFYGTYLLSTIINMWYMKSNHKISVFPINDDIQAMEYAWKRSSVKKLK